MVNYLQIIIFCLILFMGYVYLILSVDINGNEYYKIGVTKNTPEKRLKQLSTGNQSKLQLINSYESENYLKIEKWLHRKYPQKTEAENEWRSLDDSDIMSFLDECKKIDETVKLLKDNNHFYK